jgi:chromosome segregation ATPase
MTADYEELRRTKHAEYLSLNQDMEKQRKSFEARILELEEINRSQATTIRTQESKIIELEAILVRKRDVEDQLRMSREHEAQLVEQKERMQLELENASSYIIELEEKFYKSQQTSLELLKQLKQVEFENEELIHEIETLKQYIIDLKSRIAVYIPVKNDSVDKRLAEYINNYPDRQKLKIMFMRESEGVYQFGTKRVIVRVDMDRINIRVGGGFLSIDEFLDQYTPTELEKLERKDPLKRFSEKMAIQKTLQGNAVRESSPIARA